jgi:hypothetical protein
VKGSTNFSFYLQKDFLSGPFSATLFSLFLAKISYPTVQAPHFQPVSSAHVLQVLYARPRLAFRRQNAKCGKLVLICGHVRNITAIRQPRLIYAFPSIGMITCSHPLSTCWRMPRPVHVLTCTYVRNKAAIRQPGLIHAFQSRGMKFRLRSRFPIHLLAGGGACRVLFVYLSAHW